MSSKQQKSAATGIRYTDSQKKEVVDFVVQYNKTNGRGGQSLAARKFKVTPLTVSAWLKAAGKKRAKAPATKVIKAEKPVKSTKKVAKKAPKKPAKPVSELEALKAAIRALIGG